MSYAIVGLAFVLLIVCVVFAAKAWHWVNIVFLVLTFMVGVGAAISMAQVLKLRQTAMKKAFDSEKEAARLLEEKNEAVFGPADSLEYSPTSLRGLSEALQEAFAGRGRVWDSGNVEAKGNNRLFKFSQARNQEDNVGNMREMLLYAFADGTITDADGQPFEKQYPVSFVGELRVIAENPDSVELEPIFIANNEEYTTPSGTWTVFEKMPADKHEAFMPVERIKPEGFDITAYRTQLTEKYLPAGMFGLDPASKEYEQLIDTYAFDGVSIGEIENWLEANRASRQNARFEPLPQEIFILYEFTKKSKPFQVDGSGDVNTDGFFTPLGYAVSSSLKAGGEITFAEGERVYVDQVTADGYQRPDGGVVDAFSARENVNEVSRVYIRQLRDYPYMLQDLQRQTARFIEESKRVRENNEAQTQALDDANAQVRVRDVLIGGLQADNQNLTKDESSIRQLLTTRQQEVNKLQQELESLQNLVDENHEKLIKASSLLNSTVRKP